MLLLDHIAQCTQPFVLMLRGGGSYRLHGAADYVGPLLRCPLRYVLADDLVRTCTALGFSEGEEIAGCLDLLNNRERARSQSAAALDLVTSHFSWDQVGRAFETVLKQASCVV